MNPPNHRVAGRQAADLLERRLRRLATATRRRHIQRAEQIAQVIWKHWQVGIYRWRLKHVKWYLTDIQRSLGSSSQYQHYLTMVKVCAVLGHDHWNALLDDYRPDTAGIRNHKTAVDSSNEIRVGSPDVSAYTVDRTHQ